MSYDYNALVQQFTTERQKAAKTEEEEASDIATTTTEQQRQEHLQAAVQALETLSSHCPMTPLLWIQYAAALRDWLTAMGADTMTALQSQRQVLDLGVTTEFPGSLVLHCRHVQACWDELQLQQQQQQQQPGHDDMVSAKTTTRDALENAVQAVGRGAYRADPDDGLVAWLYRKRAEWYQRYNNNNNNDNDNQENTAWDAFVQQARVPLPCNQSIIHTVEDWAKNSRNTIGDAIIPPQVSSAVEEGRRLTAQVFGATNGMEDDVQAQFHQEGIESVATVLLESNTNNGEIDWTSIEIPTGQQRYGMGYGGAGLAKTFGKYASSYLPKSKTKKHDKEEEDHDDENDDDSASDNVCQEMEDYKRNNLPWKIYERGVAECPTVESLWLSYLHDILYHGTASQKQEMLPRLVQRACRNCPYSIALVKFDLDSTLQLVQDNVVELEPDVLLERIQTAWNRKFLPRGAATWCDLQIAVVSIVRQRLLSLLFPTYDIDDKKQITAPSTTDTTMWNDETREEVEDLCSDLKELFETISNKLHQQFPDYTAGRIRVMQEKALTEYHLTLPLTQFFQDPQSTQSVNSASVHHETVECLAKAARLNPHPDTFLTWIHFWQHNKPIPGNSGCVVQLLAKIRCAFLLAWQQVSPKAEGRRDFASALSNLAHEWIQWESLFGSSKSLKRAQQAVQKKYRKMQEQEQKELQRRQQREKKQGNRQKRPAEETTAEPLAKKVRVVKEPEHEADLEPDKKMQVDTEQASEKEEKSIPTKPNPKKAAAMVTINGMEYPAHPFTVRLSNLSHNVEDMDLVDLLKPKCGAIVHARIIREKGHGKTKSKGWGMVQFEELESVEKALALSGELGLHEKLVTIERSNAPAAMLVPPGMHRVKPKGEGRSSKRNERKKHEKQQGAHIEGGQEGSVATAAPAAAPAAKAPVSAPAAPRPSVLSLAPRGVMRKGSKPKAKLALAVPAKQEANETK